MADQSTDSGTDDILRVIDFSKSFRTGADVSEYVKLLELPDMVPRGTYVSLWPTTNNTLDLFHGTHEPTQMQVLANDTSALKVWPLNAKHEFKITTETWTAKTVAEADLLMATIPEDKNGALQKLATKTQVWVPGAKKGFELGGESYLDSNHTNWVNNRQFGSHSGLLVYDQETDSWTNETMPLKFMQDGVLAQLQTADDNILIAFGGFINERGASAKMVGTISTPHSSVMFQRGRPDECLAEHARVQHLQHEPGAVALVRCSGRRHCSRHHRQQLLDSRQRAGQLLPPDHHLWRHAHIGASEQQGGLGAHPSLVRLD